MVNEAEVKVKSLQKALEILNKQLGCDRDQRTAGSEQK